MDISSNSTEAVNWISSNQTQEFFAIGTAAGFEIIQNGPSLTSFKKTDFSEGVKIVEMMYKSNVLAIVLASNPMKVVLWDDLRKKNISELTFNTEVKNIRMRKDFICVVLTEKVFVFNFSDLKCIEVIDTYVNVTGICAVSLAEDAKNKIVACPHTVKGFISIHRYRIMLA